LIFCVLLDVDFEGGEGGLELFSQVGEFGADQLSSEIVFYILNDLVTKFFGCDCGGFGRLAGGLGCLGECVTLLGAFGACAGEFGVFFRSEYQSAGNVSAVFLL